MLTLISGLALSTAQQQRVSTSYHKKDFWTELSKNWSNQSKFHVSVVLLAKLNNSLCYRVNCNNVFQFNIKLTGILA